MYSVTQYVSYNSYVALSEVIYRECTVENGGNVYDQILDCDSSMDPARNSR